MTILTSDEMQESEIGKRRWRRVGDRSYVLNMSFPATAPESLESRQSRCVTMTPSALQDMLLTQKEQALSQPSNRF